MLVAPREKRNCQLPTANGAQLGFSHAPLLLSFFADWGGESQLSALGDPKPESLGGGEGREKVLGKGMSNPARCHGVDCAQHPPPRQDFPGASLHNHGGHASPKGAREIKPPPTSPQQPLPTSCPHGTHQAASI